VNAYNTVEALLGFEDLAIYTEGQCLEALLGASREIEGPGMANRVFYTVRGARVFDVRCGGNRMVGIDDLLSASAVAVDVAGDGSFSEAWTEGEEFEFLPAAKYPRQWLRVYPWALVCLPRGESTLRITGVWGYGDGQGAGAWLAPSAQTVTVADGSATTLTASASGHGVLAGHTILVEDEQLFVTAVSGTSITVRRGVNGTTPAAHAAKAIGVAQYPADVKQACLYLAAEKLRAVDAAGIAQRTIGQYNESLRAMGADTKKRMVLGVRRAVA
jgi:hypothetical protein